MVARVTCTTGPRWRTSSPSDRNPSSPTSRGSAPGDGHRRVEVEQAGATALGPLERRPQEVPEQRGGAVGPALELRVGLGADPERVRLELDELDQAPVG